jgi:predicted acylesterase/phospholipase RssA
MRIVPPRRLLFAGGGIRVISYVGVLEVLEERKLLHHIRETCGVSAGGLTALMLALGYQLHVIRNFSLQYDFSNVRSVEPEDAFEFMETYGLDNGENLQALVKKILYHKGFGPNTTFRELAASGRCKSVRLWASDIQHAKPIEFSATTTPDISVVFALHASMAIPLYFMPLKHPETDTMLVDGGIFDNYPISYLTEEEAEETLGVTFEFSKTPLEVTDFGSFVSLLTVGYYLPSYKQLIERHKSRTILIPCGEYPSMNFEASVEERQGLVTLGRQATEDFFKERAKPSIRRRHSVY